MIKNLIFVDIFIKMAVDKFSIDLILSNLSDQHSKTTLAIDQKSFTDCLEVLVYLKIGMTVKIDKAWF
jgi:hypothetical protein